MADIGRSDPTPLDDDGMAEHQAELERIQRLLAETLPPYFELVGEIAGIWAMFEQRLDHLAWDLACVEHPLGACFTSQLNGPGPRIRLLRTILHLRGWDDSLQKRLNILSHEVQKSQEARNRAVHDVALVGQDSKEVWRRTVTTVNNKLIFEVVAHSLDELRLAKTNSMELLHRFAALATEIRSNAPTPSHEKLRQLRQRQGPPSEQKLFLGHSPQTPEDPLAALFELPEAE